MISESLKPTTNNHHYVLDRTQKNQWTLKRLLDLEDSNLSRGMEASPDFPEKNRFHPELQTTAKPWLKAFPASKNPSGNWSEMVTETMPGFLRPNTVVGWLIWRFFTCPASSFMPKKIVTLCTWKDYQVVVFHEKKKSQHIHVMFGTCCKRLVRLALEPASPFASLPANSALFTHRCNGMHWICLNLMMYIT